MPILFKGRFKKDSYSFFRPFQGVPILFERPFLRVSYSFLKALLKGLRFFLKGPVECGVPILFKGRCLRVSYHVLKGFLKGVHAKCQLLALKKG